MQAIRISVGDPAVLAAEAAAEHTQRGEQAHHDLLLMLEYLAGRSAEPQASEADIRTASELCAKPYAELGPRQGEVWVLVNRLAPLIAPASVEGLRNTRHGRAGVAGWPTLLSGVVITFILALLVQAYTLFGGQTLDRLNAKNAEAMTVFAQLNAMEEHLPALATQRLNGQLEIGSIKILSPYYNEDPVTKAPAKYIHLSEQLGSINSAKSQTFQGIYQWNAVWAWPIAKFFGKTEPGEYWDFQCDESVDCTNWQSRLKASSLSERLKLWETEAPFGHLQIKYGSEAHARSNLETLRGTLLPVLYGALGAWVWLLRQRYIQIRDRQLRAPVCGEYLQRVMLGAVFGAALGYVNLPSFLPDALANVSLIGLAFIIGYNVEVVFFVFDHLFRSFRDKREAAAQAAAQAARGGS